MRQGGRRGRRVFAFRQQNRMSDGLSLWFRCVGDAGLTERYFEGGGCDVNGLHG